MDARKCLNRGWFGPSHWSLTIAPKSTKHRRLHQVSHNWLCIVIRPANASPIANGGLCQRDCGTSLLYWRYKVSPCNPSQSMPILCFNANPAEAKQQETCRLASIQHYFSTYWPRFVWDWFRFAKNWLEIGSESTLNWQIFRFGCEVNWMSIALAKGTSAGNNPPLRLGVYPYRILVLWLLT